MHCRGVRFYAAITTESQIPVEQRHHVSAEQYLQLITVKTVMNQRNENERGCNLQDRQNL